MIEATEMLTTDLLYHLNSGGVYCVSSIEARASYEVPRQKINMKYATGSMAVLGDLIYLYLVITHSQGVVNCVPHWSFI